MRTFLFVFLLWVSAEVFAPVSYAETSGEDTANAAFWESVYEDNHVVEIDISLTKEAWESMEPKRVERQPGGLGGNSDSEYAYVKANITIDGKPFEKSGLRFKGNSSYRFSSRGFKRPMKIDFNRFIKGQKLFGRTKLNLSNAFLDSAYMKEKLGYQLYRAAGIATPGVGWAAVTLTIEGVTDKKQLGVYVLIEQVDKNFLERQFGKKTKDSLLMKPESSANWEYPGDDPKLYESFDIKEGEDNEDQIRQFGELLRIIAEATDEDFAEEIGERMDLDQFAGYLAATSILASLDSYVGMPHNYYLLMDKADDKLRLLPWDVNESFGTFTMGTTPETLVKWDIDRPWTSSRRLLDRLFATKSFPARYQAAVAKLVREEFTEDKLFARIATFEEAITPYVRKDESGKGLEGMRMGIDGDESGFNTAVERKVFAIKPFIRKRIASVNAQLAGTSDGEKIEARRGRGGPPRGRPGNPPPGFGQPPGGGPPNQ